MPLGVVTYVALYDVNPFAVIEIADKLNVVLGTIFGDQGQVVISNVMKRPGFCGGRLV
jgi:hypothetical protein